MKFCKLVRARDDADMMSESNFAAQINGDESLANALILSQDDDCNPKVTREFNEDDLAVQEGEYCITWMGSESGHYDIYPMNVEVFEAADGTFWCLESDVEKFFTF